MSLFIEEVVSIIEAICYSKCKKPFAKCQKTMKEAEAGPKGSSKNNSHGILRSIYNPEFKDGVKTVKNSSCGHSWPSGYP